MKATDLKEVNGKKLKTSHVNLMAKLAACGLVFPEVGGERQNPYTGAKYQLDNIACGLVDFILSNYNNGNPRCGVQLWDRARYFLLEFYPEAFRGLID